MIEFFEVMFRALTGMKLTLPSLFSIFIFFVFGYLFAKFAKNMGVFKAIVILSIGYFIISILSAVLGVFALAFILGFVSNQTFFLYRVLVFTQDLGEIIQSFRHRGVFEDIASREKELEDEINRLKEELKRKGSAGGHQKTKQQNKQKAQSSQKSNVDGGLKLKPYLNDEDLKLCLKILGMAGEEKPSIKKIKSSYRKFAMKYHPDLPTGDHKKFVKINLAKEYLLKYV